MLYCGFNIFKRNLKEIAASKRAVNSLALMPSLREMLPFPTSSVERKEKEAGRYRHKASVFSAQLPYSKHSRNFWQVENKARWKSESTERKEEC